MASTPTPIDALLGPGTPSTRVLEDPAAAVEGIWHGRGARELVPWSAVRAAVAAEVGEPEGVRTVVFDLVVEAAGGRILRIGAEPGTDAMQLARAIARGVPRDRKLPSIESLATDGIPARWYPDLEGFEEARAELLARG